jgi:hypothetical protein
MPQLVGKINIYIRYGGFEPSTGFHFGDPVLMTQGTVDALVAALQPLLYEEVTLTRWESRTAGGIYINGGSIGLQGTNSNYFQDFKDETHVVWASGGSLKPSANFLPGRTDDQWNLGFPTPSFVGFLDTLVGTMITYEVTDSEGEYISGIRSYRPGRRRKVRLAG